MSETWMTKYGPRKVRRDPPTLAEAIAAAQGLTDDPAGQIEIAAELMGASPADVKAEMLRLAPDRRATRLVSAPSREGARTVVVERKASRRVIAKTAATAGGDGEAPARKITLSPRAR
jgi:hypothetical protein